MRKEGADVTKSERDVVCWLKSEKRYEGNVVDIALKA